MLLTLINTAYLSISAIPYQNISNRQDTSPIRNEGLLYYFQLF